MSVELSGVQPRPSSAAFLYDDPCVIVGGCARSGTTLVGAILSAHPQAAMLLEERLTDVVLAVERLASIRTQAEEPARFALFGGARSFLSRPLLADEGDLEKLAVLPSYRHRFAVLLKQVVATIAERERPSLIGSKLPIRGGWEDVDFLNSRFRKLRIILVVRNPIDVVNSSLVRGKNADLGLDEWEIRDVSAALDHWRGAMRVMFDVQEAHPEKVLTLKYEDICQNPSQLEVQIRDFAMMEVSAPNLPPVARATKRDRSALNQADLDYLRSELGDIDLIWSGLGAEETLRTFGDQAPLIEPGSLLSFANGGCSPMLRTGFSYPESWGRWTDGPKAIMRFRRPIGAPSKMRLHVVMARVSADRDGAPVRIGISDGAWTDHLVRAPGVIDVAIPPARTFDEIVTLSIEIQAPKPFGEAPVEDSRELGIALSAVELLS